MSGGSQRVWTARPLPRTLRAHGRAHVLCLLPSGHCSICCRLLPCYLRVECKRCVVAAVVDAKQSSLKHRSTASFAAVSSSAFLMASSLRCMAQVRLPHDVVYTSSHNSAVSSDTLPVCATFCHMQGVKVSNWAMKLYPKKTQTLPTFCPKFFFLHTALSHIVK